MLMAFDEDEYFFSVKKVLKHLLSCIIFLIRVKNSVPLSVKCQIALFAVENISLLILGRFNIFNL